MRTGFSSGSVMQISFAGRRVVKRWLEENERMDLWPIYSKRMGLET